MLGKLAQYFANQTSTSLLPHLAFSNSFNELEIVEIRGKAQVCEIRVKRFDKSDLEYLPDKIVDVPRDCRLRIACISYAIERDGYCLGIQRQHFEQLLEEFKLCETYKHARTSITTFDILPLYRDGVRTGLCCSVFMLNLMGLYFNFDNTSNTILAVMWTGTEVMQNFKAALSQLKELSVHPFYLLVVTIASLQAVNDCQLIQINSELLSVERRTGYHGWRVVGYPAADEPLSNLSAKMSGLATTLASYKRVMKNLEEIIMTMNDSTWFDSDHKSHSLRNAQQDLDDCLKMLSRRLRFQFAQIELHETRVRTQLTALFNLINREEMDLSLGVAKDSRTIANATKRDSSSMKILAAVTVLFLPGTFIASFFSMSMFRWQLSDTETVSPQFWIYWVTTVPLTVVTIAICYLLSRRWTNAGRGEDATAVEEIKTNVL